MNPKLAKQIEDDEIPRRKMLKKRGERGDYQMADNYQAYAHVHI